MQSENPYIGKYGPVRNPGFTHLCLGFDAEKNFLNKISSPQPIKLPQKNKNANIK